MPQKNLQDRAVNLFYIFHIIIEIGKKLRKLESQNVEYSSSFFNSMDLLAIALKSKVWNIKYLSMGNLFFDIQL